MDIKEHIESKLKPILTSLGVEEPHIILERPKDNAHGDLSSNAAMMFAKKLKSNPKEFAQLVIDKMNLPDEFILKAEIAGAGFINFYVSENYYLSKLEEILKQASDFGKLDTNKGKTADLEWVSANPTGPLHTGHGRQIALGKAIANLLEWSGYKVTREYYYNNAGMQMEKLAKSVYARYRQLYEPDYPFPEDGYVGDYVMEVVRILDEEYGDKLVDSSDDIFKTAGENWCFKSIKHTLARMGISHEIFFNESSLYESGEIKKT
ncbi:MAG: arginine--tRNA ligase, partial [Ignavibacteria bacterium]|nr:arginine--tRNA ligase [Ignavibacteria bacterium]